MATYQVPVDGGDKETASENIANGSRNHGLPNVVANTNGRAAQKDGHGNEEHVGDNVIESEGDESEDRPPDTGNFARDVTGLESQPTSDANEPVGTDGAKEDLVPLRSVSLLVGELDCLFAIQLVVENTTVADNDADNEERSSKVTKKREDPVLEHLHNADSAMQRSERCVLDRSQSAPCTSWDRGRRKPQPSRHCPGAIHRASIRWHIP